MRKFIKRLLSLTPLIFLAAFIILLIFAALNYPGGNRFDREATSFSIVYNFYSDLFHRGAYNATPNTARQLAFYSLAALGLSFVSVWLLLSNCFIFKGNDRLIANIFGLLLVLQLCLFSKFHDLALWTMVAVGLPTALWLITRLYRHKKDSAAFSTVLLLSLCLLNFLVWAADELGPVLPVIQKITFLTYCLWVVHFTCEIHLYITKDPTASKDSPP